ncbi:hypothetical protein [Motilibacter deserti]|uniref:Uncharacterized protein n=1 Tax=Motilibacter deserti TaxID=2714956 RepID=A0ABX0GRV0_9ACTN|nr:hypothetical protein [Motilibacter deserti]NHC12440.1 hypothetical protein [Motilibacter deserti]
MTAPDGLDAAPRTRWTPAVVWLVTGVVWLGAWWFLWAVLTALAGWAQASPRETLVSSGVLLSAGAVVGVVGWPLAARYCRVPRSARITLRIAAGVVLAAALLLFVVPFFPSSGPETAGSRAPATSRDARPLLVLVGVLALSAATAVGGRWLLPRLPPETARSQWRGWASDDARRHAHEAELARLSGREICAVRYAEPRYEGVEPEQSWSYDGYDAVTWGLELDLDDGTTWSATWQQAGLDEGLLVYAGTLAPRHVTPRDVVWWNVTEHWRTFGLDRIEQAVAVWWRPYGEQSALCVEAVVLRAGSASAVLTLGQPDAAGSYEHIWDGVVVFASVESAVAAGALLEESLTDRSVTPPTGQSR